MRILIAPDKFKGCLSAVEVAKEIEAGIREVLPRVEIDLMPIADGGDGTAEIVCNALNGTWVSCRVLDALGRQIQCRYAMIADRGLAVMEMSEAAGMRRLAETERDPLKATTFGVGQMILDAARRGATQIIVGLGGSATNDGGFGMARAFGFRFFDGEGMQVRVAINKLRSLTRIDPPLNLVLPPIIAAVDVQNPLFGRHGATRVFGPQKGATGMALLLLEKCLKRLAKITARQVHKVNPREPGMGAAGGLGFGLVAFAGATLKPGFSVVAEVVGAEERMSQADLAVTGEGRLDSQTWHGKGPAAIAELARQYEKPVFAIVGQTAADVGKSADRFDGIFDLSSAATGNADTMSMARELLRKCAREMASEWKGA